MSPDRRPRFQIVKGTKAYETRVTGNGEHVLLIECAVLKSSGTFTCIAENGAGSISCDTVVHVVKQGKQKSYRAISTQVSLLHSDRRDYPSVTVSFTSSAQAPSVKEQAPSFATNLQDVGVTTGQAATLKCRIQGQPEPQLQWNFISDTGKTTPVADLKGVWTEYRKGEDAEIRAKTVVKTQQVTHGVMNAVLHHAFQGTYQCVATNSLGKATTSCYLIVGEGGPLSPKGEPAGPPRFTKCLRDAWVELGSDATFDVEVAGSPMPELIWYHNEDKVPENSRYKVSN